MVKFFKVRCSYNEAKKFSFEMGIDDNKWIHLADYAKFTVPDDSKTLNTALKERFGAVELVKQGGRKK
ncbi:MAG: hypothetical protein PHF63_00535 [Herbinix sp.]|nr:hypothetical protein [Herbinix sp.]